MGYKWWHMGKVAFHRGLVQLMEACPVELLPQVEALSLLCLLSHPLVLPTHLQQVLVVRVVVSLPLTVRSFLFVHAGEAMSLLGPELEVHAPLQIQAAVGLSKWVPRKSWVGKALPPRRQRTHSHEGSHACPVQHVEAAHLGHGTHGKGQRMMHGYPMQTRRWNLISTW